MDGAEKIKCPIVSFLLLRPVFTISMWTRQSEVLILAGAQDFFLSETV
jgi:hypothetical protein